MFGRWRAMWPRRRARGWPVKRPGRLRVRHRHAPRGTLGCAVRSLRSEQQRLGILWLARGSPELRQRVRLLCEESGNHHLLSLWPAGSNLRGGLCAGQQGRDRAPVERLLLTAHAAVQVGQPARGDPQLSPRAFIGPARK